MLVASAGTTPACAQPAATGAPSSPSPAPDDLRALSDLLKKPSIRTWLDAQSHAPAAAAGEAEPASMLQAMASDLDAARAFLRALAAGLPDLPAQLGTVRATVMAEAQERGLLALVGPLLAFAALGYLVQFLFWRATAGLRGQIIAIPVDMVEQRLRAIGWRTLYGVGVVAAFALGSIGAFLAFDWPPLLQQIVLTYLFVFLAVRLTIVAGRIVLAPGAERFRILPMATSTARYWFVWSATIVGAFYFAKGTFRLVPVLGATLVTRTLVGIALSVVVLVLTLVALWRRPAFDGSRPSRRPHEGGTWLVSAYLVGVWLTAFTGATAPFDVGIVLLLVVLASIGLRLAVRHLLRQPSDGEATDAAMRPLAVIAFQRGLRIALLLGGALVVTRILDLDLIALTANDTAATRLARGALDLLLIALAADFVWQMARAWIDRRVSEAADAQAVGTGTEAELRHRQRLRTLLPVLRKVLLVGLLVLAGLTALSTLGVEVGPLLAGAGVVGIAVGFGAQTLVKDIISGMFFLLDDAFRVGEYIESGRIKGTVEAFSLRSIKLRHHRGPLHTVPFGSLSTITNYSRDWVIDKLSVGVTYDTDLDRVRRIVKDIGRALKAEPEFAPHILETLKMQGVEQFGDFAIQIRLKMMTRPGEQFTIRRHAYALIKRAFDAEGIQFAYPTVTVVGGGAAAAAGAAAQAGLAFAAPKPVADDAAGA
jgi:small-conductance mechanosensitive channel